ncbi:MAG: hypothetical protein GYA55_12950, partial [SAR324 cluster bacterium]|nr:hypothetical protein [SAR324 cluster bacterium]
MKRVGMLLFAGCFFFLSVITANADRKVGSLLLSKDKSSNRVVFVKNNPEKEFRLAAAKMTVPQRIKLKRAMRRHVKIGDALTVADNFLEKNKRYLGIKEVGTELFPKEPVKDELGMTHVYYEQRHNGIKVFGAHASVHLRKDGAVSSAGLNFVPSLKLGTTPKISEDEAKEIAKEAFTKDFNIFGKANVYESSLVVMHEGLFRNTRSKTARLAWEVKVREASIFESLPVDENYYISAKTGDVIRHISNVRTDVPLYRKVFDCTPLLFGKFCSSNTIWPDTPYPTYRFGRIETASPSGENPYYGGFDVNNAWEILGGLDAYYWQHFGLDGADGAGGFKFQPVDNVSTKVTTTNVYQDPTWGSTCPNAIFDSTVKTIAFCKGTVWPDIMGHEYQHGVLYWRPAGDMTYHDEPGALNEASSDFIGEVFEKYYTGSTDWINMGSPDIDWSKRNMADPPSYPRKQDGVPHPDKYRSPYFYCGTNDLGGVHYNSTVVSKAFYLISQGGDFNGCSIQGSGIEVAEQIMYRVVRYYYGTNESFNAAYQHIQQACADLYPTNTCAQVKAALQAVELNQQSPCSG